MRLFQPTPEPRVVAIHRILQRVLETELPKGHEQFKFRLKEHALARVDLLRKVTNWKDARWELEPLAAWATGWWKRNPTGVEHWNVNSESCFTSKANTAKPSRC